MGLWYTCKTQIPEQPTCVRWGQVLCPHRQICLVPSVLTSPNNLHASILLGQSSPDHLVLPPSSTPRPSHI